jgi:hypothetical protein
VKFPIIVLLKKKNFKKGEGEGGGGGGGVWGGPIILYNRPSNATSQRQKR